MSRGEWKRDENGRPIARPLPEEVLDNDGVVSVPGCPNPLTLPNSIGHAASGQDQGCSPNAFNPSRIIRQMKSDSYPFIRTTDDGILITDQSSAEAWGKNRPQMQGKKFKTDPTSGSAT
jgi:hypothetical protein